jgi:hypothetical protein
LCSSVLIVFVIDTGYILKVPIVSHSAYLGTAANRQCNSALALSFVRAAAFKTRGTNTHSVFTVDWCSKSFI